MKRNIVFIFAAMYKYLVVITFITLLSSCSGGDPDEAFEKMHMGTWSVDSVTYEENGETLSDEFREWYMNTDEDSVCHCMYNKFAMPERVSMTWSVAYEIDHTDKEARKLKATNTDGTIMESTFEHLDKSRMVLRLTKELEDGTERVSRWYYTKVNERLYKDCLDDQYDGRTF